MGEIMDFPCSHANSSGVRPEVTEGLDLTFPDAYMHAETLVTLARALKEKDGAFHCDLSFCHTLEAEAMGGKINMGDAAHGPRCGGYVCDRVEELLDLPDIDFSTGRIGETLRAVRILAEEGEYPTLELCGPFTVMSNLIDLKYVFKACRKKPDLMKEIWWKFGTETLRFIREAEDHGMRLILYADPTGALNILGPKLLETYTEAFTGDFVARAAEEIGTHTMLTLCPKTTYALIGTDRAEFVDHVLSQKDLRYSEACAAMLGEVRIGGMNCVKNSHTRMKDGIFREVRLK